MSTDTLRGALVRCARYAAGLDPQGLPGVWTRQNGEQRLLKGRHDMSGFLPDIKYYSGHNSQAYSPTICGIR